MYLLVEINIIIIIIHSNIEEHADTIFFAPRAFVPLVEGIPKPTQDQTRPPKSCHRQNKIAFSV